jgi:signal transduction histidine kinase
MTGKVLRYAALIAAFVSVTAAFWLLLAQLHRLPAEQDVLKIDRVQRIASAEEHPGDLPDGGWTEVSLPEDWLLENVQAEDVWYRLTLDLNVPPDRLWGVLLTGVNLNGVVYLNDSAVGQDGSMDPLSQNWNRPLYFSIPNGLLKPGRNVLHVHVRSFPAGHGFLGPMFLGPREDLLGSYNNRFFLQVQVSQFITIATLTVGLLIGVIWLLRPTDAAYGWFSLGNLLWAAHTLKFHISQITVSSLHWATFLFITAIGFGCSMVLFFRRVEGVRSVFEDRIVLGYFAVSSVVLAGLGAGSSLGVYSVATVLVAGMFLFGAYGFVRLVRFAWASGSPDALLFTGAGLFVLVFVLRDWLLTVGYMDRTSGQYSIYAAPALLVVFGFVLIRRFVTALGDSETLSRELEARVAAKTTELEVNHQRIRELERQQVLARERERIMRDMHDGVGGHLVSSLALLKSKRADDGDVEQVLQAALTDLRLMIDSLDPIEGDLNLVLANLRQRMHGVLEKSGLSVSWALQELPSYDALTPDYVLQVLRILQEALTNIVKHAVATAVCVQACRDGNGEVVIRVSDDGTGFDPSANGVGRGLLNMEKRAGNIGAKLDIVSSEAGTTVELRLQHGQACVSGDRTNV